jgi:CDP-glucose 4,6-dehydratase
MALASVRAGNVIGGGDWALDRLIPDLVRAFERGEAPAIRSPDAVRPWQHVLEALQGYLMIAERLLDDRAEFADAWNFGPADDDARPVSWIVDRLQSLWGNSALPPAPWTGAIPHEAGLLKLDTSKARSQLGWRPALPLGEALGWIVDWHKRLNAGEDARALTLEQIERYAKGAAKE